MQSDLLLRQRQTLIQDRLRLSGRVLASELADDFKVSEDTIRRDLRELAAAGLCERVYGGALPVTPPGRSLGQRAAADPERKAALATAAVGTLRAGMTVFIDAGSTNLAFARAIAPDLRLTIVTNTPLIAAALMEHAAIDLILIGGRIDRHVGAALGFKALREIEMLRPDLCVLGACGLDLSAGLTALQYEDAEFKRAIAENSRAVLAAVTNDKIGSATPHGVIGLNRCTTLVVEHDAPGDVLDDYRRAGPDIVVAKAAPS